MSFSKGGSTDSTTVNEQNPITATDNAIVASNGATLNVTDGGAFATVNEALSTVSDIFGNTLNTVDNSIMSNERITESSIDAGLDYFGQASTIVNDTFDRVIEFVDETTSKSQQTVADNMQQLFNSAKSDELNKSNDMNATIREIAKWGVVGIIGYTAFKYAFK